MTDTSDAIDVIERETAVLVRHFELLHRRNDVHDDLDRAGYLLLRTLADAGPGDINTLAAALGLDPSTAGRQVAAMQSRGLAERRTDPSDKRRCIVTPTAAGLETMAAVRRRRTDNVGELLADWDEADLRALGTMFRRYNRTVAARYLTDGPEPG